MTPEEIQSLREQLAAALAAIKVKDEAMIGALYSGSPYTTAFENALAIKPDNIDGLILCEKEPVAKFVLDELPVGTVKLIFHSGKPLHNDESLYRAARRSE